MSAKRKYFTEIEKKEAKREYNARYRKKQKEKLELKLKEQQDYEKKKASVLKWQKEHPEQVNAYQRQYRALNREKCRKYMREYIKNYRDNNINNVKQKEHNNYLKRCGYNKGELDRVIAENKRLKAQIINLKEEVKYQERLKKKYKQKYRDLKDFIGRRYK